MKSSVPWSHQPHFQMFNCHVWLVATVLRKCRYEKYPSLQKVLLASAVLNLFIVTWKYSLMFDGKNKKEKNVRTISDMKRN